MNDNYYCRKCLKDVEYIRELDLYSCGVCENVYTKAQLILQDFPLDARLGREELSKLEEN